MSEQDYRCGSRDYLKRAERLIIDGKSDSLFYAAFELRCGVEARLREYLEVADEISEKRKQGWEIVKLGKDIEKAFKLGDKIFQLIIQKPDGGTFSIYHTPVSSKLQKQAKRLGDYLHAMKLHRKAEDSWWESFQTLLEETSKELMVTTKGTLLGPLLLQSDGKSTKVYYELNIDAVVDEQMSKMGPGTANFSMEVDYLDTLPDCNK